MAGPSSDRAAPRSYLYVPGDAPAKLQRALERGADALLVDLEDAVAPAAKSSARRAVAAWLAIQAETGPAVEIWARINPWPAGRDDLAAVVCPALTGICLPKTGGRPELDELDDAIRQAERESSLLPGRLRVQPMVESARAVLELVAIAGAPRVARLQLGEMDLAADLGAQPDADGTELLFVRSQVVVVSSALGLGAPVAPVQADYSDLERFARTTAALKRLGFASRACVHPCQVPVANEMFTPTAKEVDDAERLLSTFGAARAAGAGVMVSEGGEMVDEAAVRSARRVLARARPTSTGTTS